MNKNATGICVRAAVTLEAPVVGGWVYVYVCVCVCGGGIYLFVPNSFYTYFPS